MNSQNGEKQAEDSTTEGSNNEDSGISKDRRAALTKVAYGSPVVAALLLSYSASAQASPCPLFTPPAVPGQPQC